MCDVNAVTIVAKSRDRKGINKAARVVAAWQGYRLSRMQYGKCGVGKKLVRKATDVPE